MKDALKRLAARTYLRFPIVRELRQIRDSLQHVARDLSNLRTTEVMRLLDFEVEQHPRYSNARRLVKHSFQVFSQNGEDGIIHEIFKRVGTQSRVFAEIGVGNGLENNTAFLLSQGWTGFWFDGAEDFLPIARSSESRYKGCLKWSVSLVTKENVAALFEHLGIPKEFDLLSLDIDQNTYFVWEGLRDFRPRVVVVEYNAVIPPDIDWKVDYRPGETWDGTHNFGASLKALENLGRQLGYSLVGCEFHGYNSFFVRNDLLENNFMLPFTAENHYEPPRYAMRHRRSAARGLLGG